MPGSAGRQRRAVEPQRVPVAAPVVADPLVGVEDHELAPALGQVVAGRQPGLAGPDDHGVDVRRVAVIVSMVDLLLVWIDAREAVGAATSAEPPNLGARGMGISAHRRAARDQVVLVGVRGGSRPRRQSELGEDVADVAGDRPLAQHQLGRDRVVGPAGRDQPQHLELARAQSRRRCRPAADRGPAGPAARGRARRRARRTPRGRRPARAARCRRHRARRRARPTRTRVRAPSYRACKRTPSLARLAQRVQRGPRRRPRRAAPPPARGRHRREQRRADVGGDVGQLVGGGAGRGDVIGGERDLDVRREDPRPVSRSVTSSAALRIAATAASSRPWARRSSASPGCG